MTLAKSADDCSSADDGSKVSCTVALDTLVPNITATQLTYVHKSKANSKNIYK